MNKKIYEEVEDELKHMPITVAQASSNPVHHRGSILKSQPIASLVIPNKLYLLWDKKVTLQKKLGISVSRHLDLINNSIAGTIQAKGISVETRLRKESLRLDTTAC